MELSDYEKMIIEYALAYAVRGTLNMKVEDIYELADFLEVDGELLYNALHYEETSNKKDSILFEGNEYHIDYHLTPLFDTIIRFYCIRKDLHQIVNEPDANALRNNISLFRDAIHHFEMLNINSDTAEAERTGEYTHKYLMYDEEGYNPTAQLYLLGLYATYMDSSNDIFDLEDIIKLTQLILKHELLSHSNAIYMASISQIISHASNLEREIKNIAKDFYLNLVSMLHNAKVLAVQANSLYQDVDRAIEKRTKCTDNTTRLRIFYGFDNFDAYSMRLDLAHQGEGFIHYNNSSPGKVKCCLLSKEEFEKEKEKYPSLSTCFISYGDRYALKERTYIKQEEKKQYEMLREEYEHRKAFIANYSEEYVIKFVNYLGKMLPANCFVAIDKNRRYEKSCFEYNKYMMLVTLLYCASLSLQEENMDRIFKIIIEMAISNNIITSEEREYFTKFGDICDLAQLFREKIEANPDFGML